MAKFIENKSKAVICFGEKNFIPGAEPVKVTDEEAAHPMIAAYIAAKKLELTEADNTETVDLDAMTVAQLKAYATENNIDIGTATAKADILAAIKAAEVSA